MKVIKTYELKKYLAEMIERQKFPAITVYLNTHRRWESNDKARIRLKNLLTEVRAKLYARGLRNPEITEYLSPIEELSSTEDFWKTTSSSMLFIISESTQLAVALPQSTPSKSYLGVYFNIKHLVPYLSESTQYYVLAVSPKKNFLYAVADSNYDLISKSEILPAEVDIDKSIQFHATKPIAVSSGATGGVVFHGHGSIKDGTDALLQRYLERLDNHVNKIISNYDLPLVLICTDTIFAKYKKVNNYPHLVEAHVNGNPDTKSDRMKFLGKTRQLVEKEYVSKEELAIDKYKNNTGDSLTVLTDILKSAAFGRVDTLFINNFNDTWGLFNESTSAAVIDKRKRRESTDLMNIAIVLTLKNGGEVYKVTKEQLSIPSGIVATLRY